MINNQELKKATLFKSLKAASATPNEVYKFTLRGTTTNIATVPVEIRQFKNLQYLDLSGCGLRVLPDWIGEFPNLQTLILSENSVANLPTSITNLSNLQTLDVAFNSDLKHGFEYIYTLKNLKKLKMDCQNFNLSADIQNLSNLEFLLLGDLNNMDELQYIYDIPTLKTLEIVGGENVTLLNGISKLKNLETFTVCVLALYQLPDDFSELPKLKEFGYTGLYTLRLINNTNSDFKLNVDWGQIFEELSKIKTLQFVDLQDNRLKSYHENLGLLTQVKKLNLNDMVRDATEDPYPKSFSNLKNLKELTISDRDLVWETMKNLAATMPRVKVIAK
jgi:leucine-rich repeat protein SHOC2